MRDMRGRMRAHPDKPAVYTPLSKLADFIELPGSNLSPRR